MFARHSYRLLCFGISLITLTACSDQYLALEAPDAPLFFTSMTTGIRNEVIVSHGTNIHLQLPEGTDLENIHIKFKTNTSKTKVVIGSDTLDKEAFVDLRTPIEVELLEKSENHRICYHLSASAFSELPKIYITTKGKKDITSDTEFTNAFFTFDGNGKFTEFKFETAYGEIRGRGNSSWTFPKKPYKIKLDAPTALWTEGQPYQEWVLLANCADKSLVRNHIAFEMSKAVGMDYTPQSYFVDLFINGQYQGNYQLCDQIQLEPGRVEGDCLIELDMRQRLPEYTTENYFESLCYPYKLISDDFSINMRDSAQAKIKRAEMSLTNASEEDGFRHYFDEESVIRWFLINELMKNCDAQSFSSIYYYLPNGSEQWHMGPLWDFDLAAGNRVAEANGMTDPQGWYVFNNYYFVCMRNDTVFENRLREVWNENREALYSVIEMIPEYQEQISLSAQENFKRWPIQGYFFYSDEPESFTGHGKEIQQFLQKRFYWMDAQLH
ncbi:MAG: CotH kinase family protein [Paludibacteraceae bacterium]|nr:CotH kinase family protein [Paludibacteraceae bacterium]